MTDFEKDTERRISSLESNMKSLISELRDFKTEMRQQNQMRANEIRDLQKRQDEERRKHEADMKEMQKRQDEERRKNEAAQAKRDAEFKEFQKKHDADMREMNKKIDDEFEKLSSQMQTTSLTTILGVGAIVWAIFSAMK